MICLDCNKEFEMRDPSSNLEIRCGDCQTRFRVNNADTMHKNGVFVNYRAIKSRGLQNESILKDNIHASDLD